jgi:hypothetical protein
MYVRKEKQSIKDANHKLMDLVFCTFRSLSRFEVLYSFSDAVSKIDLDVPSALAKVSMQSGDLEHELYVNIN